MLASWVLLWVQSGFTLETFRTMAFMAMIGLTGAWPALRLSQASRQGGAAQWARSCSVLLTDWLCLNILLQTVLWPLQAAADWTVSQTLWLSLTLASTSLLIGLLIAWARGSHHAMARSGAMLACVGVVVLEPALMRFAGRVGSMRISPVQSVWTLTRPGMGALGSHGGNPAAGGTALDAAAALSPAHVYNQAIHAQAITQTLSIGLAALTGWIVLLLLIAAEGRASDRAAKPRDKSADTKPPAPTGP